MEQFGDFTLHSISDCKSSRHSLPPLPFNPVVKSAILKILGRRRKIQYFLSDKAFGRILPGFRNDSVVLVQICFSEWFILLFAIRVRVWREYIVTGYGMGCRGEK